MSIRNCRHFCTRDRDTGDLFCPELHGWVDECPKARKTETENEGENE